MTMGSTTLLELDPVGVEEDVHGVVLPHDDVLHESLDPLIEDPCGSQDVVSDHGLLGVSHICFHMLFEVIKGHGGSILQFDCEFQFCKAIFVDTFGDFDVFQFRELPQDSAPDVLPSLVRTA